ncbi:Tannase [Arthrobotrys entomopaga]|nr:Tannase [Arthrobotrys entomopaga]
MKTNAIIVPLSLAVPSVLAVTPSASFERKCADLGKSFAAPNTHVLIAKYLPKGTNITFPESANNTCPKFVVTLADICRLKLNVSTSDTSSVIVESFMPKDWAAKGKRFLMNGNGGLGGCIPYGDMAFGNSLGFAAIGHNNGHAGDTGVPFYNRPQVVVDYVWRALYTAGKIGKKAVTHFYSSNIKKSYYSGCSSGGRQGMKAAQDFPEEYDGILSVAPAINFEGIQGQASRLFKVTGQPGDATFLNLDQWIRVHKMVVDQCDWIDGVLDGVLEDPTKCIPRPEALLCEAGQNWESHKCLTATQVDAVRKFYEPLYGTSGEYIASRLQPLTREWIGFRFYYGGVGSYLSEQWYQYAIFNDPSWTLANNWTVATTEYTRKKNLHNVQTFNMNLTALKSRGTKLLHYHGTADCLISSENSYDYYNGVSRTMGLKSSQLDEFYRFFPISGMDHCYTGNGAWYVGGPVQYDTPGALDIDPNESVLMKMVEWVEKGEAPEKLVGKKLVDGKVLGERGHCKYPAKTKYKGSGNPDLASSWTCENSQL